MSLTYASPPRMMTREVMAVVIPKSNDKTGHWRAALAAAREQDPRWCKFPGGSTPARGLQPGRISEPARPEAVGGTPQDSTSMTRATKPGQKSWDFDESEQDFGEKWNPPKPHASP
jgi:hypothetical protein